jgi:cytosine/uracil/thiamine/allantoin permease
VKLYHYAWFVGFGLSFGVYLALMPRRRAVLPSAA